MNYYKSDNQTSRTGGIIATCLYFVVLALLFWLVHFREEQEQLMQGIMIDFGDSDTGAGVEDMDATDTPSSTTSSGGAVQEQEYLTDDSGETEVESVDVVQTPQSQVEAEVTQEEPTPEPPREVNQRALFPGRTLSSDSSSQGESDIAEGNQGEQSGESGGSLSDTGAGVEGVSWSLSGRSVVGRLPVPSYSANATGRVVIEIIVDDSGRVTRATYRAEGSTTNNSSLVSAARTAALAAQFTPSGDFAQVGAITYTFRLN